MFIYILIFIFFIICVIRFDVNKVKSGRKLCFITEAIILILLFGLRYRVGGDSLMYEDNWDRMPTLSDLLVRNAFQDYKNQPLWYIFTAVIKEIGGGFLMFQIVHAVIINTVFFRVIKRYCQHRFTAVLFYFIFMSFNSNTEILRESLAVAVFLLSLKYLMAHKWIPYYIYCLIAFNFHISAVIWFILPFVFNICTRQWVLKKLFFIILVFIVLSIVFINNLDSLLAYIDVLSILNLSNADKVQVYTSMFGESNVTGYLFNIVNISIILFYTYVMRKNEMVSPIHNLTMNMTFVFTAINLIIPIMGARWAGYFSLLYYICLADMFYSFKGKASLLKVIAISCILFNSIITVRVQLSPDPWAPGKIPTYVRYIPYHSIFDKKTEPNREASVREIYDI